VGVEVSARNSAAPATALSRNSRTPSSATLEAASPGIRSRLPKSSMSTVLIGLAVVRSNPQPTRARAGNAVIPASMRRRLKGVDKSFSVVAVRTLITVEIAGPGTHSLKATDVIAFRRTARQGRPGLSRCRPDVTRPVSYAITTS
jgi:hypothetical protein